MYVFFLGVLCAMYVFMSFVALSNVACTIYEFSCNEQQHFTLAIVSFYTCVSFLGAFRIQLSLVQVHYTCTYMHTP